MDNLQLRDRLYQKLVICTILFACLSIGLCFIYVKNVSFFETHGKIGYLAEIEQQAVEMENSRKLYSKKHIAVNIVDEPAAQLIIPFSDEITEAQISIREDFLNHKLIITLKDEEQIISANAKIVSDSKFMNAMSLYQQREDTVIELFCKDIYAYQYTLEDGEFIISFSDLKDQYERMAVIYVPYDKKDSFSSEEWLNDVKALAEKEGCKAFICPQMQELYTQEEIVAFANQMRVDYLLAVDVDTDAEQTGLKVVCNPRYFIPDFHSVDLGMLMGQKIMEKTGLPIIDVISCNKEDIMISEALMPAATINISMARNSIQSIEEEYSFYHRVMEGITLSLTEILTEKNGMN